MPFTHLHVHTEYSLLDGLCRIPDIIKKAKEKKMTSLAITDHGAMYGVFKFFLEAKKQGIKPIIGVETYLAQKSYLDKQPRFGADQYHLTLIAKNNQGYKNLLKLITLAHLKGYHYRPRIDLDLLTQYREGLFILSGCLQGQIGQALINNQLAEAEKIARRFQSLFGQQFYLEIMNLPGNPDNQRWLTSLVKLSRQLGIPLVATNDVHYIDQKDADAQDALLAVQTRKTIFDKNRLTMIDTPVFYLKSAEEMAELFKDYPDALENTQKIANQCQVEIPFGQWILPQYPLAASETASSSLKQLAHQSLKRRFPQPTPEVVDRLNYELDVICNKGFATYFLIVQDFVNWAKSQGIRVGPGRGSAAGSLVSYVLRITSINPLEHNLPFERFMNPQRPTPPDIDLDFADDRRDEVIQYVMDKYGTDKVAQIITFGTMEARGSIRDIGRVLGLPYSDPDRIAKLIPLGYTIEESLNSVFDLQEYYRQEKYKKLLDLAKKVEGIARHASTHAAGVVISDQPLTEYVPLQTESKAGKVITQYDMYDLDLNVSDDAIGLLKMDFLGLRNLTTIGKCTDYIKQSKQKTIDMSEIPLDDAQVFQLLSQGETIGIFQLESPGMRRVAKNLKPSRFSDITAMIALYRPGPMELINDFIAGKQNPQKIKYPHPDLKPILAETYGIAVYQEQCLQIAHLMAGFSLGDADILRRAIGKKKKTIMEKEKKKFINGAKEQGYTEKVAQTVWRYIEKFAGYGFNKAHSASYAMIAYQNAYLKANFPVEYMTALLSTESNNTDKISLAIEECRRMKIAVLPPDINSSQTDFSIDKNDRSLEGLAIRFGFSAIKNVGKAAIEAILEARNKGQFHSITDFCSRVDNRRVNKKVIESLVKVGAFDQFGKRSAILINLNDIRNQAQQATQKSSSGQTSLFDSIPANQTSTKPADNLPLIDELPQSELLHFEKQLLGFYLSEHPHAKTLKALNQQATHKIYDLAPLVHQGKNVILCGLISSLRKVITKNNNSEMAFAALNDETGTIDVVIFPGIYAQCKSWLATDIAVLIKGKVDYRDEKVSLLAEEIINPQVNQPIVPGYTITIPRGISRATLTKLRDVLKQNPGTDHLSIRLPNGQDDSKEISLPYTVNYSAKLQKTINQLLKN